MKSSDDWAFTLEAKFADQPSSFCLEEFIIRLDSNAHEAFDVAKHRTPEDLCERKFVNAYVSMRLARL